jgi:hypothetical protein
MRRFEMSVKNDEVKCASIACGKTRYDSFIARIAQVILVFILVYALLVALVGCNSIDKVYIEADLATYGAIAPEYSSYVGQDESLSDDEKQDRYALLDSWLRRIYSVDMN